MCPTNFQVVDFFRLGQSALRAQYGAAARHLVEAEFSSVRVGRDIVALYATLLQHDPEKRETVGRS